MRSQTTPLFKVSAKNHGYSFRYPAIEQTPPRHLGSRPHHAVDRNGRCRAAEQGTGDPRQCPRVPVAVPTLNQPPQTLPYSRPQIERAANPTISRPGLVHPVSARVYLSPLKNYLRSLQGRRFRPLSHPSAFSPTHPGSAKTEPFPVARWNRHFDQKCRIFNTTSKISPSPANWTL